MLDTLLCSHYYVNFNSGATITICEKQTLARAHDPEQKVIEIEGEKRSI